MKTGQEEKQESAKTTAKDRPYLSFEDLKGYISESKEYQEMAKYSITPTTFHSRNFFNETTWYKDIFEYADREVIRFGINSKLTSLETIIAEEIEIQTIEGPEHTRSTSSYKQEEALAVQHHSLEKLLLQKAVDHLLNNKECKSILVDIFERSKNKIKIEGGIPKIHTIVLYKNPPIEGKYEITVIDPSNFLFSSHLSGEDLDITHDLLAQITTIHKGLKIYKPLDSNTGPKYDQFRDCIDIATKIAFGLSQHGWVTINLEEHIKKHPVIEGISNNTDLDKNIIAKLVPNRIKQASDILIIEKFNKIQKALKENLAMVYGKYFDLYNKLATSYKEDITHHGTYSNTLKDLINFNEKLLGELLENLNLEHTTLAGELNENF